MNDLVEAIRSATVEDATPALRTAGIQACRTILRALEARVAKPVTLPGTPLPNPLAGIDLTQALDYLIARLREDPVPTGRRSTPPDARFARIRPVDGSTMRRRRG